MFSARGTYPTVESRRGGHMNEYEDPSELNDTTCMNTNLSDARDLHWQMDGCGRSAFSRC